MSEPGSTDDLDSVDETLAILSDPLLMEQIRESEQAVAAGEPGTSLTDLRTTALSGGPSKKDPIAWQRIDRLWKERFGSDE